MVTPRPFSLWSRSKPLQHSPRLHQLISTRDSMFMNWLLSFIFDWISLTHARCHCCCDTVTQWSHRCKTKEVILCQPRCFLQLGVFYLLDLLQVWHTAAVAPIHNHGRVHDFSCFATRHGGLQLWQSGLKVLSCGSYVYHFMSVISNIIMSILILFRASLTLQIKFLSFWVIPN